MEIRTTESVAVIERLCEATKGLSQEKAAIAAMVAESFINGMHTQERLTADSTPQQAQT